MIYYIIRYRFFYSLNIFINKNSLSYLKIKKNSFRPDTTQIMVLGQKLGSTTLAASTVLRIPNTPLNTTIPNTITSSYQEGLGLA